MGLQNQEMHLLSNIQTYHSDEEMAQRLSSALNVAVHIGLIH